MSDHQNKQRAISISLPGGRVETCPVGTPISTLLGAPLEDRGLPYIGALFNHDVVSLSFPLEVDGRVEPLTLDNPHGYRIYRRSVCFLLAKAVRELFPEVRLSVEHSLGTGFYCAFERDGNHGIQEAELEALDRRMRELVEQDLPIDRTKMSFETAMKLFRSQDQEDKYNLLRFRNPPTIVLYSCGNFSDLAYAVIAPHTGTLEHFKLIPYAPGFVIQFPGRDEPPAIPAFNEQPQLFHIFKEHKEWGRILGLSTVGRLNETIAHREVGDFVKISEALHEKKIARIADEILLHHDRIKFILVAGPSSAGKTTMTKRLSVQLRVNGLTPASISVDDYFVDREHTPRDEDGGYDFEHIEAIDLDLFNEHLVQLDRGNEVELPRFNFETGAREASGNTLRLNEGDILILEGIHALNPRLSASLPDNHKFKIYISALGQLNFDRHNRISTTDNRLLRRLVRDHKFRGHSALTTLRMWPSVRRGEKKWIFPNQQQADIAFNSALDYELAVLRPLAEPLLAEVKPMEPEYADARRLLDFLSYFLVVPEDLVPSNSILREYIGESGFEY